MRHLWRVISVGLLLLAILIPSIWAWHPQGETVIGFGLPGVWGVAAGVEGDLFVVGGTALIQGFICEARPGGGTNMRAESWQIWGFGVLALHGAIVAFVPGWFACAACLPLAWWTWRRGRMRVKEGCCRMCGYDLRASPERCPECGAARV